MEKTRIELPEGYVVDLEKTTPTNVVLKKVEKKKPKTWAEIQKEQAKLDTHQFYLCPYGSINRYTINSNSTIRNTMSHVPTQRDAERIRALCQLLVIAHYYNEGWEPDWTNGNEEKFMVVCVGKDTYDIISRNHTVLSNLVFKTPELAREAVSNNKEIFDAYYKPQSHD